MTNVDVDRYLAGLDEPKRATLQQLRLLILELLPDAEETISYGMPAYKVRGKTIVGFAAFKDHLSYLPHSGAVLPALADQLGAYEYTKGSLHFAVDQPLPRELVSQLIHVRLAEPRVSGSTSREGSVPLSAAAPEMSGDSITCGSSAPVASPRILGVLPQHPENRRPQEGRHL